MKLRFFSSSLRSVLIVAAAGLMSAALPIWAQGNFNPAGTEASQSSEISQETLDSLLAPIALYPDALLAQVLMAATYPIEVIEAARWQQNHSDLSGQALQDMLVSFDWDPSVKSLVTVPQVLQYMSDSPRWMQDLGYAVLSDQPQVMATVQALRQKAYVAGTLMSNDKQTVRVEAEATSRTEYITIVPASTQVVYVPVYDPYVVYGNWWWPSRPIYWGPPPGVVFTGGYFWGPRYYPSIALWGGFNWGFGVITINAPVYHSYYRVPPPMMGPHNVWRRPPPPRSDYYHRPPQRPPYTGRPPAYQPPGRDQRPPAYQPPGRDQRPPAVQPPRRDQRPPAIQSPGRPEPPPSAGGSRGDISNGTRQTGGQWVGPDSRSGAADGGARNGNAPQRRSAPESSPPSNQGDYRQGRSVGR
jgi:hypothetical protein